MEDCVRAVLTGVAIGVFTAAVVKVNLFVIDKIATINALAIETAVGMGVFSLETIKMRRQKVQSLLEATADSATMIPAAVMVANENPKYTSPCLTTNS